MLFKKAERKQSLEEPITLESVSELNNRVLLDNNQIPKAWFNIVPYLPEKPYPAVLADNTPATFEILSQLFPIECVKQAGSQEEFVPIPRKIRELYALCNRPTPLQRAFQLEKAIGVDSDRIKIFFKCEFVSPTGSHKTNTAIAQSYYGKQEGIKGFTTETGAGQWGSALSMANSMMGLETKVFQVRASYNDKPGRRVMMQNFGAELHPSPSNITKTGQKFYQKNPNHPGSLGIAIAEAVEMAMTNPGYKYSLGSVLDFVLLHQTVIGLEAQLQMEKIGEHPSVIMGSIGGGSNFAGLSFPFFKEKLTGERDELEFIGVEPCACPSLTKGRYTWDYGDSAKMAPIIKMYSLGANFIPPTVHAGGLRYHGAAPLVSMLKNHNKMKSVMVHQTKTIEAGILMAKTEGILPAVETNHVIAAVIDKALEAQENHQKCTILFNFSGHGYFDTHAYQIYHEGKMIDYEYPDMDIQKAMEDFPHIDENKIM
ncbi:TrpB-like pyridoxal phosphate-dependent enzyme [Candidatus Harpocratesius sp.]